MKEYAGMTVNIAKSIKSGEDDINEEQVYAELNILVSETNYEISNTRDIVRSRKIEELEIMVTASTARGMAESLLDLADRLEVVEQIEKEKHAAYIDSITD